MRSHEILDRWIFIDKGNTIQMQKLILNLRQCGLYITLPGSTLLLYYNLVFANTKLWKQDLILLFLGKKEGYVCKVF